MDVTSFPLGLSTMVNGYREKCMEEGSLNRDMMRLRASGWRAKRWHDFFFGALIVLSNCYFV